MFRSSASCAAPPTLLGPSRAPLGTLLGPFWASLGRLSGALGALLAALGALLGRSWALLGRSWGAPGPLLALLGGLLVLLDALGALLGRSGGRSGLLLALSWVVFRSFGIPFVPVPLASLSSRPFLWYLFMRLRSARKSGLRSAGTSASVASLCFHRPTRAAAVRSTLNKKKSAARLRERRVRPHCLCSCLPSAGRSRKFCSKSEGLCPSRGSRTGESRASQGPAA